MPFDLSGLDRLIRHLEKIQDPNPRPLLDAAVKVLAEDNRRGVLEGTDGDGGYMLDVTYRPEGKAKRTTKRQRNNVKGRTGKFAGLGMSPAGMNNNLSSAEYRKLGGPPLAPRGRFSRVVTNYTQTQEIRGSEWIVTGAWLGVVDAKGRKFLGHHFRGDGDLPKRNLAGLRPWGRKEARRIFVNWARDQIRYNKGRS